MRQAAHRMSNGLRYREPSHPNQTQLTPPYVLEPVREALGGGIELDPCTEPDNPCGAVRFYAPPTNGLMEPWDASTIYVNPPYGKARGLWVRRCVEAASAGRRVVLLMPAATDTAVWQQAVLTSTAIVFIRGRVKFGVLRPNRRQQAASHPSALIGWNVDLEPCASLGFWLLTGGPCEHPDDWGRVRGLGFGAACRIDRGCVRGGRGMSETPEDVFEAVLTELQDWKWERWIGGTSSEFQQKLDENSREWRERFAAARNRARGWLMLRAEDNRSDRREAEGAD